MSPLSKEKEHIHALSLLTLVPSRASEAVQHVASLTTEERQQLLSLADAHHVVLRSLEPLREAALINDKTEVAQWAAAAMEKERARIDNALPKLEQICTVLEEGGCPTTVIKSLDHWPDIGNDLDLYTTADSQRAGKIMRDKFAARLEPRSWGDRLANKWNFRLEDLSELVEVHAQRLGQTGEHIGLAKRFVTRRVPITLAGYTFLVPAPEERVIVATLQRVYRHFYFRVCDIVNTAKLVESGAIDFQELKKAADIGGIWTGVATYLKVVSDYVAKYRGAPVELPGEVLREARFGGEVIQPRGRFLRVPVVPQGAELYTRQVTMAAMRGDVPATFRLSLLPYLASAAAISYRLTGSDKGIW